MITQEPRSSPLLSVVMPYVIGSLSGTVFMHPPSGQPQAAVTINYTCPAPPGGTGPGGNPAAATYPVGTCAGGSVIAQVAVEDPAAAQLINMGDIGNGPNEWLAGSLDGSTPTTQATLPPTINHCDADAALHAEQYLQTVAGGFTPATFGLTDFGCADDDIIVAVDTCLERGDDSTYGFQLQCCPPPPPPEPTLGMNCYGLCVNEAPLPELSIATLTHNYGPTNPTYTDPNTVCQDDLINDTTVWMDTNAPGGPSPVGGPLLCGPNWGANVGGFYVPGTLNATCQVTNLNDVDRCMGGG